MANYEKARGRLQNTQLNKLKSAAKNKTVATLKVTKKNFQDKEFLTTRQKTKIRNAFDNNMLTVIKLSKAQLSKIIQSGGFLGNTSGNVMGNVDKKPLIDLAVCFGKMFCLN